jgi:hypothetical protein
VWRVALRSNEPGARGKKKTAIDPNDAVILLIDDQSGLFQVVKDIPLPQLRANLVALARAGARRVGKQATSSQAGDFRAAALRTRPRYYSRAAGSFNSRGQVDPIETVCWRSRWHALRQRR